jgi:hypothetical protein
MRTLVLFLLLSSSVYGEGLQIRDQNGRFLGNINNNPTDLNSINNPYGPYGNPNSTLNIRAPISIYNQPFDRRSIHYEGYPRDGYGNPVLGYPVYDEH